MSDVNLIPIIKPKNEYKKWVKKNEEDIINIIREIHDYEKNHNIKLFKDTYSEFVRFLYDNSTKNVA